VVQKRESGQRGVQEASLSGLIARDSGEDVNYGQEVRKTFPLSDFFINTGNGNDAFLHEKLSRILEIVTRTKIVTPTKAETAMYTAYAASLNSGCLSRQVGAVVTDENLDVLGLGWNDVPKFGVAFIREIRSQTTDVCIGAEGSAPMIWRRILSPQKSLKQ
jgi:deoxycytidylate deaminase